MYPILFSLGSLNFYTHGLMIALGALVGGFVIFYLAKKEKLPHRFLFGLLVFSLFAGIIGARIAYVILYYFQFTNWQEMFLIWHGGLVSFGGIIAGFLVAGLLLRKYRQNILKWFDMGVIGLFFGWTLGRIGCLLTGDVPGINSTSRFSIWGQIPVSLFEAIWTFILACILLYLLIYLKIVNKWGGGLLFFAGIAAYSLGRFIIDFWRAETVIFLIKGGQIGSLVILISASLILFFYYFLPKIRQSKGENYARENF